MRGKEGIGAGSSMDVAAMPIQNSDGWQVLVTLR